MTLLAGILYALGMSHIDDVLLAQKLTFQSRAILRQIQEMRRELQ